MCLSSSYNSIEELDMLNTPINLKYRNKYGMRNPCGGVLTVTLLIFILALVVIFVNPFLAREIPRVRYENYKENIPYNRYLKKLNFFTAIDFTMQDKEGKIISNTSIFYEHFDINAYYVVHNDTNSQNIIFNQTLMVLKNCTMKDLPNRMNDSTFFEVYGLENSKCLNIDDSIYFVGSDTSLVTTNIEYSLKVKDGISKDVIENLFSNYNFLLDVYYSDVTTNLNDYNTPIENFLSYYQVKLKYDKITTANIKMALVNVTTDYSYIISENSDYLSQGLMHHSSDWSSSDRLTEKENQIANVIICNSKYGYSYSRYYMKIPELLAQINSTFNVIYIVISIVNLYIKRFNFETLLMNQVFEFKCNFDEVNSNRIRSKKSNDLGLNLEISQKNNFKSPSDPLSDHKLKNSNLNPFTDISKFEQSNMKSEMKSNDRRKLSASDNPQNVVKIKRAVKSTEFFYSWGDSFNFLLCRCCAMKNKIFGKKMLYYRKAINNLENYLNIDKIVKKLVEIDFLKYCILDNDQLNLINISKLPTITDTNNDPTDISFSNKFFDICSNTLNKKNELNNISERKINEISKSFIKLSNHENTMINKNLVDSSKENFYEIFK